MEKAQAEHIIYRYIPHETWEAIDDFTAKREDKKQITVPFFDHNDAGLLITAIVTRLLEVPLSEYELIHAGMTHHSLSTELPGFSSGDQLAEFTKQVRSKTDIDIAYNPETHLVTITLSQPMSEKLLGIKDAEEREIASNNKLARIGRIGLRDYNNFVQPVIYAIGHESLPTLHEGRHTIREVLMLANIRELLEERNQLPHVPLWQTDEKMSTARLANMMALSARCKTACDNALNTYFTNAEQNRSRANETLAKTFEKIMADEILHHMQHSRFSIGFSPSGIPM